MERKKRCRKREGAGEEGGRRKEEGEGKRLTSEGGHGDQLFQQVDGQVAFRRGPL
jgi:hypothetical protein